MSQTPSNSIAPAPGSAAPLPGAEGLDFPSRGYLLLRVAEIASDLGRIAQACVVEAARIRDLFTHDIDVLQLILEVEDAFQVALNDPAPGIDEAAYTVASLLDDLTAALREQRDAASARKARREARIARACRNPTSTA